MPTNSPAIRPLLIKQILEQMRQCRCSECGEQDMIRSLPLTGIAAPGVEPPAGRERAEDVLIGAPCQNLRGLFYSTSGMPRDRAGNHLVCPRRANADRRHRQHPPLPARNASGSAYHSAASTRKLPPAAVVAHSLPPSTFCITT